MSSFTGVTEIRSIFTMHVGQSEVHRTNRPEILHMHGTQNGREKLSGSDKDEPNKAHKPTQ